MHQVGHNVNPGPAQGAEDIVVAHSDPSHDGGQNQEVEVNRFAVICAVLSFSASVALADTVTVNSDQTTVLYQGFTAGVAPFASDPKASGFAQTVGLNAATFNIGTGGGVWSGPIAGTSYVSFDANSAPGGVVDPNGYYTYSSVFSVVGGVYNETLSLLADDTVAVYLNGVLQVPAGAIGGDGHCADNVPNCLTTDTVSFLTALNAGNNTLLFVVEQTGLNAQGLDFKASFTSAPTPEPSSLIMLGSGLLSGAGMLLRRRRTA
jgi:hypothetical protein